MGLAVRLLLVAVLAAGCTRADDRPAAPEPAPAADSAAGSGAVSILFLGNSHTARNDVPGTVAALLRSLRPGQRVEAVLGPGSLHLDERGDDPATREAIESRPWDYVVLQAQNYSLSGARDYPTAPAEALVRLAREQGAVPVLYAEWARRDVDETTIILDTYRRIAEAEPACLPPVPEAFDLALEQDPRLVLHGADGNHATPAGSFLAAAVLASAMAHEPAARMADLDTVGVPAATQAELRAVADEAFEDLPDGRTC